MSGASEWTAAGREAWSAAGRTLAASGSERQWELADWAAAGEAAFGAASLRTAAGELNLDVGTLRNAARVGRAFPTARRRPGLGYAFHHEVARLPEAEAERLLDAATVGVWSRREMREAAREASTAAKLRRARDEIDRLREENARLRTDAQTARAEARRVEHGVMAAAKAVGAAYRDVADALEAFAAGTACAALHGNARPAVRQRIEQILARAGSRAARLVEERIAPALDRIERGGDGAP